MLSDDVAYAAWLDAQSEQPCVHGNPWQECEQCTADFEAELVRLELAALERVRDRSEG